MFGDGAESRFLIRYEDSIHTGQQVRVGTRAKIVLDSGVRLTRRAGPIVSVPQT